MQAQQINIDTIANNIANVNTTGFKQGRAEFQDLLYQNIRPAGTASSWLCTKNTSWALIERPYSCAPQAVGAVYDRPGFFVQSPIEASPYRAPASRHPVCAASVASRLFFHGASTPPLRGGEWYSCRDRTLRLSRRIARMPLTAAAAPGIVVMQGT